MKILLLGGYGNVGVFLSELILANTSHSIIIAGRNKNKAERFKQKLTTKYDESRIEIAIADASDTDSLINNFNRADFIINSASTIEFTGNIIQALLRTKKDYFDVLMSSPQKLEPLKSAAPKFLENNQCIITDGGFHPGIPAALVHFAATQLDELISANVGSLLNMDWKFELSSPDTIREFIGEFKYYDSSAFVNKQWKKLGYKDYKNFDFGSPFGNRPCISMMMEEMKELPDKYQSLQETGFFISGFNWFTDYLVTPLMMLGIKILPAHRLGVITNLFKWSIEKFSKPPFKVILQLLAEGIKDGKKKKMRMEIIHEDGYYLTAAPMFACLKQYLDGRIRKPGLFYQANVVEPIQFINDLRKLYVEVKVSQV